MATMEQDKKIFAQNLPNLYPLSRNITERWFLYFYKEGRRLQIAISQKIKKQEGRVEKAVSICSEMEKQGWTLTPTKHERAAPTLEKNLFSALTEKKGKLRKKSYWTYHSHINLFCKWLNDKTLTKTTGEKYALHLEKLAAKTSNSHIRTLRHFFNILYKKKQVDFNPFLSVEKRKVPRRARDYFKPHEREILKKYLVENDPALWLACQFVFLCFVRNGNELTGLQVSDVDLNLGRLLLRGAISKNKNDEWVKIPNSLLEQLKALHLENYPPQYFLVGKNKKPTDKRLSVDFWQKEFRKVVEKLKLKGTIYTLKNSGVVTLHLNGVPLWYISKQLRHRHLTTTQIYLDSLGCSDAQSLNDFAF
jgi:integrase